MQLQESKSRLVFFWVHTWVAMAVKHDIPPIWVWRLLRSEYHEDLDDSSSDDDDDSGDYDSDRTF